MSHNYIAIIYIQYIIVLYTNKEKKIAYPSLGKGHNQRVKVKLLECNKTQQSQKDAED